MRYLSGRIRGRGWRSWCRKDYIFMLAREWAFSHYTLPRRTPPRKMTTILEQAQMIPWL